MFLAWKVAPSDLSLMCNECFNDAFGEDGREEKIWKNVCFGIPGIRELVLGSKLWVRNNYPFPHLTFNYWMPTLYPAVPAEET